MKKSEDRIFTVRECPIVENGRSGISFNNESNPNEVDGKKPVSYWNALYLIVVLLSCNLSAALWLLIPMHNAVEFPEYWYELLFPGSWLFVMGSTYWCNLYGSYMNMKHLLQSRSSV